MLLRKFTSREVTKEDFDSSQKDYNRRNHQCLHSFFIYMKENIFKNIEAQICKILRIF